MSNEMENQKKYEAAQADKFNRLFAEFKNQAVKKIYETLADEAKKRIMDMSDAIAGSDKAAALFLNTKKNDGDGGYESKDLVVNFILSEEAKNHLRSILYENKNPWEVKITFFDADENDVVLPTEISSTIPEGQIASDPYGREAKCVFVLALRQELRSELEKEIAKDPNNVFHIMRALCAATGNHAYGDVIFSSAELPEKASATNFVIEREKLT